MLEDLDRHVDFLDLLEPVREHTQQACVFEPQFGDARQDADRQGTLATPREEVGAVEEECRGSCPHAPARRDTCREARPTARRSARALAGDGCRDSSSHRDRGRRCRPRAPPGAVDGDHLSACPGASVGAAPTGALATAVAAASRAPRRRFRPPPLRHPCLEPRLRRPGVRAGCRGLPAAPRSGIPASPRTFASTMPPAVPTSRARCGGGTPSFPSRRWRPGGHAPRTWRAGREGLPAASRGARDTA